MRKYLGTLHKGYMANKKTARVLTRTVADISHGKKEARILW